MKLPFLKKERKVTGLKMEPEEIQLGDIIAPSSVEIKQNYLRLGERLCKTFFVFSYPRYLSTGWLSPAINLNYPIDISLHIHPINSGQILRQLRRKLTEIQAEIMDRQDKGLIRDPTIETAYQDIESLRDDLQTARERVFRLGLYITVYGDDQTELRRIETTLRSIFESRLIYIKPVLFREKEGFISSAPYGLDKILVHTPMNTAPLSSIFPFVSPDLSANEGILYGLNQHNNSLVLFDRFTLENANSVIFAKSGSGKSLGTDAPVLIKNKGKEIQLTKIGPLIEKIIKKQGIDFRDEELEGKTFPGLYVWTFDENLKGKWGKVKIAARKKAPKIFYKFKTQSGREITTTEDHNLVVLKDGEVVVTKGSEAKRGDFIPLPRAISTDEKSPGFLNSQKKSSAIPFSITKDFLGLAGFITAEGTVTKNTISISNTDKETLSLLRASLKKLNIPFSEIFHRNRIEGINIYEKEFVNTVRKLGGKGTSGRKKVWPFIFNLDKEQIAQYLSAYFEGDGGVEVHRFMITANSKSKQLLSEIAYLLLYFGIIGRISKTKKKPTNCNWKRKKTYWRISISGQDNLRKFAGNINFVSQRKRKQLSEIIKKQGNTNVDVIPEVQNIFKEIYQLFGCQLHKIQDVSNLKRGYYNPSPEKLKEMIGIIEERVQKFKDSAPTYSILSKLPSLAEIIDLGKANKELNRKLWQSLGHSWQVVKNEGIRPRTVNAFEMIRMASGQEYQLEEIKRVLYSGFQEMDLPVKYYNKSLQSALKARPHSNTRYDMIQQVAHYIWQSYQDILINKIPRVEEKLRQLKILANSELFWDPITDIKKIENKNDKYVYDLTCENGVFLAGEGGMFVHNSYFCKLEILRYLMQNIGVIIIDPENEYEFLTDAVGGSFFKISLTSSTHINPFDLPLPGEDEKPEDILRTNTINLVGLLRIMLGGLTPREDGIIDRALTETYAARDITPNSDPATWGEKIPLMSDLETVLAGMEGTESLVQRLRKFTTGSYAGFFNQPSNVSMDKRLVVFGIRDMEDELRPMAMFIILRYIWNTIRAELKKRILLVDEAWWIMQTEDGASFLFGICKRARKYWLGVSTITQDVSDFMKSEYGKPIITNSSLQFLMKQSPATIDVVQRTFNLTDEEKYLLLECAVGEGIFLAGTKRVALKVVASYAEDQIITTSPEEVLKARKAKKRLQAE